MNTPEPTPNTRAARDRRAKRIFVFSLLALVLLGVAFWSIEQWWRNRPSADESRPEEGIIIEERWRTVHDRTVENGRVYDQATVELTGATELIIPADRGSVPIGHRVTEQIDITVRTDGQPGVVRVLLEKRRAYYGHPPESVRLRALRENLKVWKRLAGTVLVLDTDAGMDTMEGGTKVHALFVVPPNFPVRREPLSSPVFRGRFEDGWRTGDERTKAAGWEEVPQRPLPESLWPLPIARLTPLNIPR